MYTSAYIRWYYGYKNFWDELLLLGVISYLHEKYSISTFIILTPDTNWLDFRLSHHPFWVTLHLETVSSFPLFLPKNSLFVLWWGEVLTDARPFPYNWRSYFFKHSFHFLCSDFLLVGGIWTIKKLWSSFLYKLLLPYAKEVVMRDLSSYDIANMYCNTAVHYHDFAFDALSIQENSSLCKKETDKTIHQWWNPYVIINVNIHIWNKQSKKLLKSHVRWFDESEYIYYFFPASVGIDDADSLLFSQLQNIFPTIRMIDRTKYSLSHIKEFFVWSDLVISARLHVVLMWLHAGVETIPLVYQEKVQRLMNEFSSFR